MITQKIALLNEISQLTRLTGFIEQIGDELGLTPSVVALLNLALEESVSNIMLYAYPQKTGQPINIEAQTTENVLVFTITDSGTQFDPTQVREADITLSAEERPMGGLGIFLIKKIMNEVEYQRIDGTNVFTLKKNLR